jgi:Cu-Zn family superoxide dismutase
MISSSSSRRAALALALGVSTAVFAGGAALAAPVKVPMALVTPQGPGAEAGTVTLSDSPNGVTLTTDLHGLPPGRHGFHLHANPSCQPGPDPQGKVIPAGAAGGHLDPAKTGKHLGPTGGGHLGDLPRIDINTDGTSRETVTAPEIRSIKQFSGHALMIHVGGDNYSDTPQPLGGGGARLVCGVVP